MASYQEYPPLFCGTINVKMSESICQLKAGLKDLFQHGISKLKAEVLPHHTTRRQTINSSWEVAIPTWKCMLKKRLKHFKPCLTTEVSRPSVSLIPPHAIEKWQFAKHNCISKPGCSTRYNKYKNVDNCPDVSHSQKCRTNLICLIIFKSTFTAKPLPRGIFSPVNQIGFSEQVLTGPLIS